MLNLPKTLFSTPDQALTWALNALAAATSDAQDPWQQLIVNYQALMPETTGPSLKTVVLRSVDEADTHFTFYTDTRSAKWAAFRANPGFQALFYCPQRQVQLAVRGRIALEMQTPLALATFEALTFTQRQAYTSRAAPGSAFVGENLIPLKQDMPSLRARYFGMIKCYMESADFVSLHRQGHQRISVRWHAGKALVDWVVP